MIFNLMPHFPVFIFSMITSIFMVISSNNWMFIWVGLELNLLSFIPMAMYWNNNNETEGMVKYFLIQAVASGMLLMIIFFNQSINISSISQYLTMMILLLMLLLKLGGAPCHFWFPQVMNNLPWMGALILSTIQKINPILIFMFFLQMWSLTLLLSLIIMNSMTAGLGGLNQTQLKSLFAYSSIGHLAWMFSIPLSSTFISISYLMFYILISTSLILFLMKMKSYSLNQFNLMMNQPLFMNIMIFLNLLSLAGLPPLLGFMPKWLIINSLSNYYLNFTIMLILGSLITLFFYLSLFFSSILNSLKSMNINSYNYSMNILTISILPLLLLCLSIYALAIFY